MEYLPWIIVAVLAIVVIILLVALSKAKNNVRLSDRDLNEYRDKYQREHPYYVDSSDRLALASFITDNMTNNVTHPHHADVSRIVAKWAGEGERW